MTTDQIAAEAADQISGRIQGCNWCFDDIIKSAIEKATKPYREVEDKICQLIEETKITEPEGDVVGRVASLCSWAKLRAGHEHVSQK